SEALEHKKKPSRHVECSRGPRAAGGTGGHDPARPSERSGPGSRCHLRVSAGLDYRRRLTHWARCGEGRDCAGGVRGRAAAELCAASGTIGGPRDWALVTGGAAGGDSGKGTGITAASRSDPQRRGRSSSEQSKLGGPEGRPWQCERGSAGATTTRSSIRGESGGGDRSGTGASGAGVVL
ncbi:hypothetical protein NDU88_002943, partial [Pleurodeles waltl]